VTGLAPGQVRLLRRPAPVGLLSRPAPVGLLLVASACAGIVLIPMGYLVLRVGQAGVDRIAAVLLRPRTWEVAVTSLCLAGAVALAAVVLGTLSAVIVARTSLPAGTTWAVLLALPLAMPSYVVAYAAVALVPGLAGLPAAWLVLTLCTTPYVSLPVLAALRAVDGAGEEVARSLGVDRWRAFLRVTWPQVRPAAFAGALLAGLYALSDFGAVSILRVDTFTRAIYTAYRAGFDRSSAAVLALLLVGLALILVWLEGRLSAGGRVPRVGAGVGRPAAAVRLGWAAPAAMAVVAVPAALAVGVPCSVLLMRTLAIGTEGLIWADIAAATLSTLLAGVAGMVAALALALPVGLVLARYRPPGARVIASAVMATQALPGVVVGLALVLVSVTLLRPWYQTLALLAVGYGILFMAKAVGSIRSSVERVVPGLEEVARSQGCRPLTVWRRVTLPIAAPGIVAGSVLVMLTVMKELPVTLMLRPTGFETLATELWSRTEVVRYGAGAPYALVLVCIAVLPAWWLARVSSGVAARPWAGP